LTRKETKKKPQNGLKGNYSLQPLQTQTSKCTDKKRGFSAEELLQPLFNRSDSGIEMFTSERALTVAINQESHPTFCGLINGVENPVQSG
jgi:hypothetical protein